MFHLLFWLLWLSKFAGAFWCTPGLAGVETGVVDVLVSAKAAPVIDKANNTPPTVALITFLLPDLNNVDHLLVYFAG